MGQQLGTQRLMVGGLPNMLTRALPKSTSHRHPIRGAILESDESGSYPPRERWTPCSISCTTQILSPHTHTHPLHAVVVSISMKLGSALPADRNRSLAVWGSISMRAWSRICILCLKAFASESGSASSRFSSCNPTSSTGSSDSNSFGTFEL